MKEITSQELEAMRAENPNLVVIDVREAYEHEQQNLGGINIPMSELEHRAHEIPKGVPVVMYCRSGSRSGYAVQALSQAGWNNLVNLRGGMMMAR